MIKMFASDLDGTLLNALHEADGTIRRAIRELTEAGLHVVPATGRSTLPIGEHGFTGLALDACCSNGSIVRDSHGEVLKTWTIDPQVTEELLKAFPDICFDCSTPDGMYSSGSFEMHQAGFKKDSPIKRIVMRGMRARGGYHEEQYFDQSIGDILRHDVCKINCRVTSPELERDLKAYLAERSDRVVNAPFDPVMFEITDVACNKGESVAWLAGYYGIAEDEVAVYGDGGNDIAMLKRFRHTLVHLRAGNAAANLHRHTQVFVHRAPRKQQVALRHVAAVAAPSPNTCSPPCASKTPAPSSNNVTKGLPPRHIPNIAFTC